MSDILHHHDCALMKTSLEIKPLVFQDHFGLHQNDTKNILDIALAHGGDFSEVFLEYKTHGFISMEEDIIKSFT